MSKEHEIGMHTGIGELLSQDLSAYEYFSSLPPKLQEKVTAADVRSFSELQALAARERYFL